MRWSRSRLSVDDAPDSVLREKLKLSLDSVSVQCEYSPCVAALAQLDRAFDYESKGRRFESYMPHQLEMKASGNGGFSFLCKNLLDVSKTPCEYSPCVAALAQLDRAFDYESKGRRFESYMPHQLEMKASGNGGFFFYRSTSWAFLCYAAIETQHERKRMHDCADYV